MVRFAVALAAALAAAVPVALPAGTARAAAAEQPDGPLPAGEHTVTVELPAAAAGGQPLGLTLHTYKPPGYSGGPLLMVFHGAQRNARTYLQSSRLLAERLGALAVVPLFDGARFPSPRYQGGGIRRGSRVVPPEEFTARLVPLIAEHIRAREGRAELPLILCGHSAGSLFLEKLAAFSSVEARALLIANPSALVFPSRQRPFPGGFGGLPEPMASDEQLRRYLARPIVFLVGALDRTQRPFRAQAGPSDYERALQLARERGWTVGWRLLEVPSIGHDHRRMFQHRLAAEALGGRP
jgi:hypothetical protein